MNKKTSISIITPTYNMGKYLQECIQSVLKQDYPYIEHIIQDGGSTDNTQSILKKYSKIKSRKKINWVSKPDRGQNDALNKALKRSKGDVLLILNADDTLLPSACSWAIKNLNKYPKAGVIYGQQYLVNEQGKIKGIGVTGDFDYTKFLCIEQYMATQAAFIRRSAFKKAGLYIDTRSNTMPDYDMWLRIAAKCQMKEVKGIITRYRIWNRFDEKHKKKVKNLIEAKSIVLERMLKSPSTADYIKKLKSRAYAGMYLWVSEEMLFENNFYDYFLYTIKALFTYPHKRTIHRIAELFRQRLIPKLKHE